MTKNRLLTYIRGTTNDQFRKIYVCSVAIIWSGIDHLAYGYSIGESLKQDCKRINLPCEELFIRAGKGIKVDTNVLIDQCSILYREDVRSEIERLRNITTKKLNDYNTDSINRRLDWFNEKKSTFSFINQNLLDSAYNLLLCRLNTDSSKAQIIEGSNHRIVFHSENFCPTLEACKILNYDTRYICKHYNENATDVLIKQIDHHLKFVRNYDKLRPYFDYCEEMIILEKDEINCL